MLGLEFRITDLGCFYKFNPHYFIPNADTRKFKGKHFALQKFSDALQVLEKPFVLMSPSNNMDSMYFLLDRVHTSIKQSSDLFSYYSMFFFKVVFSKDPSNAYASADSSKLFKVRVLKQGLSVLFYFMIIMIFFIYALWHKVHIQLEADSNKKKKNLDVWTAGSNISKQGKGNSVALDVLSKK